MAEFRGGYSENRGLEEPWGDDDDPDKSGERGRSEEIGFWCYKLRHGHHI